VTFQELELLQGHNEIKSLKYRDYFRTKQTARNTSIMAPPEFRINYFTGIPYCRMACQVISERIELDSITVTGNEEATKYVRKILKAIGGPAFVNQATMTAMEYGRAYLVPTGTDRSDGLPGVQVIPGQDMVHSIDPFTGEILEALRVYGKTREKRVLYTRTATLYLTPTGEGRWTTEQSVPTTNGKVACFPLVCRGEVNNTFGRPEAKDAFTLQDAACRIATDMAIASATMAVPQRALLGVEADDFTKRKPDGTIEKDANGDPIKMTGEQIYMARMLTVSDSAAKLAEFSAAQLQNFTIALNAVTRQAAAVLGVPQSVFGVASDANPASGDAIRQDDARLIRRAEQLTQGFETAWVDLFQYLLEVAGWGELEVQIGWVDPSLPNLATRADAVMKLATIVVGGRPLYSWEELRKKLGDSLTEIDAAKADFETNAIMDLILKSPGVDFRAQPGQVISQPVAEAVPA
jgi:hypothetical protein